MSALAIQPVAFSFHETHDVRIQIIGGEPWFCLKDVIEVLDIPRTSDLVQVAKGVVKNDTLVNRGSLDPKGVCKTYVLTEGGKQQLTFINEPNLYRVIFRSNKPEARQFQDWVFNDVLPTLRKTGRYEHPVCEPVRTTSEPLTPNDMHNLNHLVSLMSMQFHRQTTWSRGVWYALRKATGVASPAQFTVSDLPAVAEECRRLIQITRATNDTLVRIEKEALRRIVRNGEDCACVLAQLQQEAGSIDLEPGIQTLARFERLAIERMERRQVS